LGSSALFIGKIQVRAHSRGTEIVERVVSAVCNLLPESMREEQHVSITKTEGQAGDSILVIEMLVKKRKACTRILDHLFHHFSRADRFWIANSLEDRLDEQCTLFLRIDKQAAYLGRIEIATGPDVISLRIHFRNYPRCEREQAKAFIEKRLLEEEV
jgi:hypothetical protein